MDGGDKGAENKTRSKVERLTNEALLEERIDTVKKLKGAQTGWHRWQPHQSGLDKKGCVISHDFYKWESMVISLGANSIHHST